MFAHRLILHSDEQTLLSANQGDLRIGDQDLCPPALEATFANDNDTSEWVDDRSDGRSKKVPLWRSIDVTERKGHDLPRPRNNAVWSRIDDLDPLARPAASLAWADRNLAILVCSSSSPCLTYIGGSIR